MTTFFTSDHHFSHKNIIEYCNRPFKSVEEMDQELIKRWNNTVGVDDTVYYLGDFSLSIKPIENYLKILNGKKYLVTGNHDQCHPCHGKKVERLREKYLEFGFDFITNKLKLIIDNQWVSLNHMPYEDECDQRYEQFRPKNIGEWLLHGHVHNRWKIRDKMINVGVDVWDFYPVSLDKIIEIINKGNDK